ncbi:GPW/gp25 family protein [Craterilacuibacter sp. RT1T]|uniref:GPW/gp25 family protein n=1 Tax=Craterilacuibacter sp. RT1T TaxID=2942211 RepID=UPI0020BEFA2F|nr:GPW/gp25 family protein [Craterilacuibacter sp. RT1T]MCL6262177.1 GPW/gp25 family protein [Craterilacuibacter sp. RT1T]
MSARYIGLSAATGTQISDLDHIRQSIAKILTTPIGSRVMRRDFGSLIPQLIDQPFDGKTRMRLMAASVMAIARWEPRARVVRVDVQAAHDGLATVSMEIETETTALAETATVTIGGAR